ncbi:amidohydrolase [Virgibacillus dakarensis]|uniref:amidohydrolase n=1 Tax=Virgibacillus dakarensis TaxID=1917889 RepID=UPI000B453634|nr:amidohydrolase [Virgibacillus dakarensis]
MNETTKQSIHKWFHYFHSHPEVSWKETETTNKLAEILETMDVSYYRFSDITGLVAEIGEGEEVIAVRADIDALYQEVDGRLQANHSCGHDANMVMVLGALLMLKNKTFTKRIRFIFQPAEEKGNGANAMSERGVIDDVSYLFGIHLRPIEELAFGEVTPSIHHGAGVFLDGKIQGVDAHGARPHQGKNAIDVLFSVHQLLNNTHFSPFEPYSIKLTKIQTGGENINIIPGTASFAIDLRAQKNDVLYQIQEKIEQGLIHVAQLHNVDIQTAWIDMTPGAIVAVEAASIAEEAIREEVGNAKTMPDVITPGSDDFHFYTIRNPNLKATMIGVGADLTPGLHHPNMTFRREALEIGARVLAKTLTKCTEKC